MKNALNSNVIYWTIVFLASCLLMWGWSVAVTNLIHGTTVVT